MRRATAPEDDREEEDGDRKGKVDTKGVRRNREERPRGARGHTASKGGVTGVRGRKKAQWERESGQQTILGWVRKGKESTLVDPCRPLEQGLTLTSTLEEDYHQGKCQGSRRT